LSSKGIPPVALVGFGLGVPDPRSVPEALRAFLIRRDIPVAGLKEGSRGGRLVPVPPGRCPATPKSGSAAFQDCRVTSRRGPRSAVW